MRGRPKQIIAAYGMSVTDMANEIGVSTGDMGNYLSKRYKAIGKKRLKKINDWMYAKGFKKKPNRHNVRCPVCRAGFFSTKRKSYTHLLF